MAIYQLFLLNIRRATKTAKISQLEYFVIYSNNLLVTCRIDIPTEYKESVRSQDITTW